MGRLSAEKWEMARAEYEVRGISLGEIARRYAVDIAAVSRRAKKEGWIQGKSQGLVERKVAAVKEIMAVKRESQGLPLTYQHTIESVAKERLQADGALAAFDLALIRKGMALLEEVADPSDFELLARSRKHLAPQTPKNEVKVSMTQQAAIAPLTPKQALQELAKKAGDASDA